MTREDGSMDARPPFVLVDAENAFCCIALLGRDIMTVIGKSVGKAGTNFVADVRAVQCLLNLNANMVQLGLTTKLPMNGRLDKATQDAIVLFQTKVMKVAKPDGRVDARGSTVRRLMAALPPMPTGPYSTPSWLNIAHGELGVSEASGRAANNPRILEYLATVAGLAKLDDKVQKKDEHGKPMWADEKKKKKLMENTGYKMSEVDETAWCACFVNWCLKQAGEKCQGGAQAEPYHDWGDHKDEFGSVTVIYREPMSDSASGWHVGFWLAGNTREGYVGLLGGNQNNSVCRKWFCGIEPGNIFRRWPK